MVYELVVGHDSPFTHARPVGHKYSGVTIHHWDDPAKKPTFEGTVAWLTRPAANASAHFVVEAGRVAVLADPAIQLTWHAGDGANGPGNTTQISIEVNPRWSDEDYLTVAELVRELRRTHGDIPLYPHRHWTITQCPGIADLERIDRLARAGDTMIFSRHPVNNPSISQLFGVGATRSLPATHPTIQAYGNYQPWGHDGIDYACPEGSLVYAPGPGVIEYAGWGQDMPAHVAAKWGFVAGPGGWPSGIITLINHNGTIGSYLAHKSRSDYDNRVGQWIPAGTVIGLSGNTGRSGGPHVHWSAVRFPVNYNDGLYSRVNPLDYFTKVTNIPVQPGATGDPATKQEDTLSAAEVKQINAHTTAENQKTREYIGQLLVSGYSVGGQKFPGATKVDIENQRRLNALTTLVTKVLERPDLSAAEITAAVEAGLANGAVTVDINVKGAPNVV